MDARLGALLNIAGDAIVTADAGGLILSFNEGAEQTFGYEPDEVIGRSLEMLMPSRFRATHATQVHEFGESGERSRFMGRRGEIIGLHKDGREFPAEASITKLPDNGDTIFAVILRDITLRKEAESALQANRAKNEFLSRMSHELRTPLNVILGFGQILQMDPLNPDQAEAVEYILNAGRHLLELIDEVLDLSRIEADRLAISLEPLLLGHVLSEAVSLLRPLADSSSVTIEFHPEHCNEAYVRADRQRLKQVVLNLLSNAIKYNREGGRVTVACAPGEEMRRRVTVADTGLGIRADRMGQLFTPFERLGAEATSIEGTGLGLALSQRLVHAMGGEIGAESEAGVGTTFWLELPAASRIDAVIEDPADSAAHRPPEVERGPRVVLYIEDNLANYHVVEWLLKRQPNTQLLSAMQGRIGIQLAHDHRPDVILLDLHLPDISGERVLAELRADPVTRNIPVVVASADATAGTASRMIAAGAYWYLSKPINVAELLTVLDRALADDDAGN